GLVHAPALRRGDLERRALRRGDRDASVGFLGHPASCGIPRDHLAEFLRRERAVPRGHGVVRCPLEHLHPGRRFAIWGSAWMAVDPVPTIPTRWSWMSTPPAGHCAVWQNSPRKLSSPG